MVDRLVLEEIEDYDDYGEVTGVIDMKTITLYTKDDIKTINDDYWNYNKNDLPFLSFEEHDSKLSEQIKIPCLKEVLRIKLNNKDSKIIKKFFNNNSIALYGGKD